MWALWNYEAYQNVNDYEKWEPLFCEDEDIKKQIEKKVFVPIYIFEDGCRAFSLKILQFFSAVPAQKAPPPCKARFSQYPLQ